MLNVFWFPGESYDTNRAFVGIFQQTGGFLQRIVGWDSEHCCIFADGR